MYLAKRTISFVENREVISFFIGIVRCNFSQLFL